MMTEQREPQKSVADEPLVQELYPIMSQVIDECGGVCRMNTLLGNPDVIRIRNQLPKSELYKISKIIADESAFFTLIDNSAFVATATGYENQFVDLQGELTDAGKKAIADHRAKNMPQPRDETRENGADKGKGKGKGGKDRVPLGREVPADARNGRNANMNNNMNQSNATAGMTLEQRIKACRRKFNDALANVDMDMEFDQAVNEAKYLRRELKQDNRRNQNQHQPMGREQNQGNGLLKRERQDAPRGAPDNKRARPDGPAQRQATSKAPPAFSGPPPTAEAQMPQLEKLMRAVVEKLENDNVGSTGCCLTHLSTAEELRAAKSFMHPGMRFGEVFSLCYPQIFDNRKDERNQMYISLKQKPPTGPCPPAETLEIRHERRRGTGQDGMRFRGPRTARDAPFEQA